MSRYACVAIDYENLKHFYRTLGLTPPEDRQVMYGPVAGRFLALLKELSIPATLFVIGEDARYPQTVARLREFAAAGHEIANHSMTHPFGMRRMSRTQKAWEIDEAQRAIEEAIGGPVVGFKSPAHDIDQEVIDLLDERGYRYDASVYPSWFNPLLNAVYRTTCRGGRATGLGDWQCMLAPNRPYRAGRPFWRNGGQGLMEFPITQLPGIRFPFYSTVLFTLGMPSFHLSLPLVRQAPFVTYVLHSIDLFDASDEPSVGDALKRLPAMRHPLSRRVAMLREALGAIARTHRMITYREAVTDPLICDDLIAHAA